MEKSDSLQCQSMASGKHKQTFVVRIEHCRNGTWQGKVVWAEENRTVRFRSALELIRLMNDAMATDKQQLLEETGTGT